MTHWFTVLPFFPRCNDLSLNFQFLRFRQGRDIQHALLLRFFIHWYNYKSLLFYELLSANLIYILYVFIVALMFLCSREYGNMIALPTLNVSNHHCFDIHNLHSGYTVSHRVNLYSFYLRVNAAFIRVLSKFIRAYITRRQTFLLWRIHMLLFLLAFIFLMLRHCTLVI